MEFLNNLTQLAIREASNFFANLTLIFRQFPTEIMKLEPAKKKKSEEIADKSRLKVKTIRNQLVEFQLAQAKVREKVNKLWQPQREKERETKKKR